MEKKLTMKRQFTLLLAFFLTFQLFGQEKLNLFKHTSRAEIGFTEKQSAKLNRMIENPIYLSHHFVQVNELIEIQKNGTIRVNLPDKNEVKLFVYNHIDYRNEKDFVYYGVLNPDESDVGYIHLIAKDGFLSGQINIEEEVYDLQDLGDNKNVLFKIDHKIYTGAECGTPHTTKKGKKAKSKSDVRKWNSGCDVRVLVLFTAAANAVGNPQASANLFMQQTNDISCNSEAAVDFVHAGTAELVGFVETGDPNTTRDNLQMNAMANQLRMDFEADLVVLLTDGNWVIPGVGQVFGTSFLDEWGDPDFGYAVAEIDAAGGRFTFTHEIAHDFGCKHNDDNRGAPDFVFDARGHSYTTGWWLWKKTHRTVMNQLPAGSSRIMHFSNPDVDFSGQATGVANQRENEDQMSAEGCNVADYVDFNPPLNAFITGPASGWSGDVETWCVTIQNCPVVTSIIWESSTNGFNYFPMANGPTCVSAAMPDDMDLWLRVTVVCNNGQMDTDVHHVWNLDESGFLFQSEEDSAMSRNSTESPLLKADQNNVKLFLYPNPTQDNLMINLDLTSKEKVTIGLYNSMGQLVKSLEDSIFEKGNIANNYNVSTLLSGYYLLKVKVGDEVITKTVVKE